MATVQDLINQYNGHIFGITGPDQGQCTAVPHAWERLLGLPIVYGNAKDTFANAPDDLYHKELNTPAGVPSPGAIIVWDSAWGAGYGHTAVVTVANVRTFDCLEQNDGEGGVTHVGRHDYAHIIGWFTPRVLDAPPAPVAPPVEPPAAQPVAPTPEPVAPVAAVEPTPEPTVAADVAADVPTDIPFETPSANEPIIEEPPVATDAPDITPTTSTPAAQVKPGFKTTEFYVAIALLLLPIANLILGTHISSDAATLFVTTLAASAAAVVGPITYIVGRFEVKTKAK
jgi:hypothetical protein